MSDRLVLIDSSAWIAYFWRRPASPAGSIERILASHRGATNALIRVELLTGARDEEQYARLEDALAGLHMLELSDAVWRRAERMRYEFRKAGHLLPLPDVVIACSAILHGCELMHKDRHFDRIAQSVPLKILGT